MTNAFQVKIPSTRFSVEQRGQFTIVGKGDFGGKAKDLMEKQDAIVKAGFLVPPSIVLTTEFFTSLYETARQLVEGTVTRAKLLQTLMKTDFDSDAFRILEAIADSDLWLAVRSSQLKEHGGTGQYLSGFCKGPIERRERTRRRFMSENEPAEADPLDVLVKKVVASSGNQDMAVLIQPVMGDQRIWDVKPDAAGWAYSTRLQESGEGKMCTVAGLGTKAVMIGGWVHFFGSNGELRLTEEDPSPSISHMVRATGVEWDHCYVDPDHLRFLDREIPIRSKALEKLLGRPQYIEFALEAGALYCVQCADTVPITEEKLDKDMAGKVIASSTIVNGVAQRDLQDVIWAYGQDPNGSASRLVTQTTGKYLLVVCSSIFSEASPYDRINRDMFPNVGGIVVIGTHSRGNITAGEHIRNGFGRDVPFMVVTDLPSLDQLGGEVINDGDWKLARGRFGFQVNEAVGIGKLTYLG